MTSEIDIEAAGLGGVVGRRDLIALQTVEIGTLTSHPIPIVPGQFITIAGRGPVDSNGSGKTTFLSAITLILADPQWRLHESGKYAARLLFRPEPVGLSAKEHAPATVGYIVGVFGERDADERSALSVWIRLQSGGSPYAEVRWSDGLVLARGKDDAERLDAAHRTWATLRNRVPVTRIGDVLYGSSPRCMSYLHTDGTRPEAPSLVSEELSHLKPEEIGDSLIALAGLTDLVDKESDARAKRVEIESRYAEERSRDEQRRLEEESDLAAVADRDRARDHVARVTVLRRLHAARRFLDVRADDAALAEQIEGLGVRVEERREGVRQAQEELDELAVPEELQQRVAELEGVHQSLQEDLSGLIGEEGRNEGELERLGGSRSALARLAELWDGTPAETLRADLEASAPELMEAEWAVRQAAGQVGDARTALERIQAGHDPDTAASLARLDAAGLPAAGLLDAVTLDDDVRAAWEPRLWPYRHAVVVAPGDRSAAMDALRSLPGSVLVTADGPLDGAADAPLPTGVTSRIPIRGFLASVEHRTEAVADPASAHDGDSGVTVIGGFPEPIAGRDARIRQAQARLKEAEARAEAAQESRAAVASRRAHLENALKHATAAEQLAELDERLAELKNRLADVRHRRTALRERVDEARTVWMHARTKVDTLEQQRRFLAQKTTQTRQQLTEVERELAKFTSRRGDLPLRYWTDQWGGDAAAAEELLGSQEAKLRSAGPDALLNHARDALNEAVHALYARTPAPSDVQDLVDRFRDSLSTESLADRLRRLQALTEALDDVLTGMAEHDRRTRVQIEEERRRRQLALSELDTVREEREEELQTVQKLVREVVKGRLEAVSATYDRLDRARGGFGARLIIQAREPAKPEQPRRWAVTPAWVRDLGGEAIPYKETGNSAQKKIQAIQLVLAALLSDENAEGRVLVLDELGNSLGDQNRSDILAALQRAANSQRVTVFGTCQDAVFPHAASYTGEILWFSRHAVTSPFNDPTRVWGFDDNGERVELTHDWITRGAAG
ncbi:hypothetical protein [Actinoallomurus sp. CA-150999]|uniref:hypothetical protein n=1 Tax=Actinoallomurus sp. CA-150999 TaxID=3239887 RepID=UPI003D90FDD8